MFEVFTVGNYVRSGRSSSQFPVTAFVCIKYLLVHTNSGEGWKSEIIPTCKILIVAILRNEILYLTDFLNVEKNACPLKCCGFHTKTLKRRWR